MNKFRTFAQQTFIYGLSSILPRFLIFLLNPLYSYNFPQADLGIVTMLYSSVIFIQVLLTFGLETGFFYFSRAKNSNVRLIYGTTFHAVFAFTLVFCIFGLLNIALFGSILKLDIPKIYIRYIIIIVCIDIICTIPFVWLRYYNRSIRFAAIKIVNVIVNFTLSIVLIWFIPRYFHVTDLTLFGFQFTKSIELIFIANLFAGIVTFLILLKDIYPALFQFDFLLFRKLIAYSFPIVLTGLIVTINDISDRYLLVYFLPSNVNVSGELGIYAANIKLAVLMTIYVQIFKLVAEPLIFKQKSFVSSAGFQSALLKYFSLYGFILFLFVMAFVDLFKYFVGPSEFWVGLPVIPVYLMANLFMGFYFNLSFWYKLANKPWWGIAIALGGLCISVIISIIFIPRYGYFICAWSHLASYFLMFALSLFLNHRISSQPINIRPVFIYLFYTLVVFSFIYFIQIDDYLLNLVKNTTVLILFLIYLERKEKIFSIFYQNENQSFV